MVVAASKVTIEAAKVINRDAILEVKGLEDLSFNSSPTRPPPTPLLAQLFAG